MFSQASDRLKEIPLQNAEITCIGTHQINKLETQHAGTYDIAICYGVGKRYSRLKLLWSETTLSLFGFVTRFILHIR